MSTTNDPRAWELRFASSRRGVVANAILSPIRDRRRQGLSLDPADVLPDVTAFLDSEVERRATYHGEDADDTIFWRSIRAAVDRPDFPAYLTFRIGWDTRSPTETKKRSTPARSSTGRTLSDPPTAAQLVALERLGYRGPRPETLGEASRLIAERAGARR